MRLFLLLLCLCLAAQESQEPKRPKETLALIDQARSLPPEFCADVLLKLAGSRVIPDAKWKRELIEEAFTAGAHAPLPYARSSGGLAVESRWNQEYSWNGLEGLTLETRAVDAMLELNAQRAAAMFQDIVLPTLPKEKCEEPMAASVSSYYDTAGKVFARGFTASQRQKEEDVHFLEQRIAGLQAPAQVQPLMRMIFDVKVDEDLRKHLLAAYSVVLDTVSGSDRAYATYEPLLIPGYNAAVAGTPMFLTSLRGYIVRQASGPRCSDHIKAGELPRSALLFNSLAAKVDPGAAWLKPISQDEAKPGKDEGTFPAQRPYASKRAWSVLMAQKWLDHGQTDPVRPWTAEERKSLEWNDHFNDALKLMEGWKEEEENSTEEYLINVAQSYAALAAMAPQGAAKENVMGRFLNFIETRYAETANRNLWFTQVQAMLGRVKGERGDAGRDRDWALEHFSRSRNPIIALYAKLEEMAK